MHPPKLVSQRLMLTSILALALYRALLAQCNRLKLNDAERNALRETIQYRFWKNRLLRKDYRHLNLQFTAGYAVRAAMLKSIHLVSLLTCTKKKALDVIDAAIEGDAQSLSRIQSLLKERPPPENWMKKNKRAKYLAKLEHDANRPPKAPSIFERFPRPTVKGIRKVPFIVNANGIPFLRYKKPQPENVSRSIRNMVNSHNEQIYSRRVLEEFYLPLSEYEDEWDEILRVNGCWRSGIEEPTWLEAYEGQLDEVNTRLDIWDQTILETGKKLFDIVKAEQALAEKEAEERRRTGQDEQPKPGRKNREQ